MGQVVAWDPEGEFSDGSVVDGYVANRLGQRGGVCLPVATDLLDLAGAGGYFRRNYGEGVDANFPVPRTFCPLVLYMRPGLATVSWAVRIWPDVSKGLPEKVPGNLEGSLQLVAGNGRGNSYSPGLNSTTPPVQLREVQQDRRGGWTVRGSARASHQVDGYYGFALYGRAAGGRIAWAAISISE